MESHHLNNNYKPLELNDFFEALKYCIKTFLSVMSTDFDHICRND